MLTPTVHELRAGLSTADERERAAAIVESQMARGCTYATAAQFARNAIHGARKLGLS